VGATLPTLGICMLVYYLLMRWVIATGDRGGYRTFRQLADKKITVGL
jgi:hypothetical protein